MKTSDELLLDMPCFWKYLAEILVEMCAKEVINFKDVANAMAPKQGSQDSAKFLSILIKLLVEVKDMSWVKDRWVHSQVSLTDFINEKDVNNFVKQNVSFFSLPLPPPPPSLSLSRDQP